MSDPTRTSAGAEGRPRGRAAAEAAIIAAARRLYRERSPAEVTMREIAEAAGVNRGLLHHYFGSKEDLLAAIVSTASERAAAGVREADGLIAALGSVRGQGPAYARMLAWALISGADPDEFAGRSPTVAALLEQVEAARRRPVSGEDGRRDEGAADTDDRMVVAAALTTMLGWQVFEPFMVKAAGLDDLSAEERAAQLGHLIDTMVASALR